MRNEELLGTAAENYLERGDEVFVIDVSNFISSSQSESMLANSFSVIKPASFRSIIQYDDSSASFSAIYILAEKSALLWARWASLTLAPMLVPQRSSCFDKICSDLSSFKYL